MVTNVSTLEKTPAPFWTLTLALPVVAIRLAGTAAVNWALVTKVVLSGDPFHKTMALFRNPVPFATRVKVGPPTVAAFGVIVVSVSCGELVTKVRTLESTPTAF